MEISKTGPVISILHESKEPGRMLLHLVNKLVDFYKVLSLSDLNIIFFMVLKPTNITNSDKVLK